MAKHPLALARLKYQRHKAQAKFRNIEFKFTFEDWYDWWLQNGIDKNDHADTFSKSDNTRLCMCRYNDSGAYEPSNVYVANHVQNVLDQKLNPKPRKQDLNYRWGNELKTLNQIRALTTADPEYFRSNKYERNRAIEAKLLYSRLRREHGSLRKRTQYHWAGVWYGTLKAVAAAAKTDPSVYKRKMSRGVEGYQQRITITVEQWMQQHSRYPDYMVLKDY